MQCHRARRKCICRNGFMGDDCSKGIETCPNDCSNHGLCVMGSCKCDSGYSGLDCSARIGGNTIFEVIAKNIAAEKPAAAAAAPAASAPAAAAPAASTPAVTSSSPAAATPASTTSSQPRFRTLAEISTDAAVQAHEAAASQVGAEHRFAEARVEATAEATIGQKASASLKAGLMAQAKAVKCPNDCSGKGVCDSLGVCHCDAGRTGVDCAQVITCPDNCSGNGICQAGKCYCDSAFYSSNCSLRAPTKRLFPQPWVTAILSCIFFFVGMVVGRKTLAYSLKQLGEELEGTEKSSFRS